MAYSPDGRYLAVACGDILTENHGTVKLWDVAAGRLLHSLEGHTKIVWGVAYSPDGKRLASASFDHKVKIWDPSTGQETLTLHGHTDNAIAVAFSPDGHRLASGSEDGTIRIWDASPITEPPARELLTLTGHTDEVRAVAYSPDGRWIASAGDDMIIRLWDAESGRSVRLFRGHATRHPWTGVQPGWSADRLGRTRRGRFRSGNWRPAPLVLTIHEKDVHGVPGHRVQSGRPFPGDRQRKSMARSGMHQPANTSGLFRSTSG